MLELTAFLGNPGLQYARNRHNAAWLLTQELPFAESLSWQKKFNGLLASMENICLSRFCAAEDLSEPQQIPEKIYFLKPQTFMNCSGDSVIAAASFFKIKPENIIIVHDELELALGTISLKFGGGLGGHNGLRSMKANFGTADFWRLRIGIGRPDNRLPGQGGREGSGEGIIDWVLSDFSAQELEVLEPVFKAAADLLTIVLVNGPQNYLPKWAKVKIV